MDWPWPIWKRMIQDEVCQQQHCEPRSLRRVGWWGKNWAMPLGAPKNGDLADCRTGGLPAVFCGGFFWSWWKGRCQKIAAFGSPSSMTDGSDGKWKAPHMILDRFWIRTHQDVIEQKPLIQGLLPLWIWRLVLWSGPQLDKKAETIEKNKGEHQLLSRTAGC